MENYLLYIVVQLLLILIAIIIMYYMIRTIKLMNLEKRILRFSVFSLTDKPLSLFDKIKVYYDKIISKISNLLSHSKLINKSSKRYEKYIDRTKIIKTNTLDIISNKIIVSIFAVVITIISDVLRGHGISLIQLLISMVIGYFIIDLILIISHKRNQKQIEDDFLKAVLIMSNAFKSGRSIMQAVEFVSKELDGPVGEEFKKMYIDLNYGLDLEVVFDRMAKRINLEETRYMASSLVIINKTGGNIIKIFSSIEKSFFERKKLNDELKSVTALSQFVFKTLVTIPIIVFIMIYILNPTYFMPFINTLIGNIILTIIIFIYVLYIVIVKKVIKVKEWYYE